MELPEPVRQRLGNFSRTMFRDANRTEPEYSEGPGEWPRPNAGRVAAEDQRVWSADVARTQNGGFAFSGCRSAERLGGEAGREPDWDVSGP